MISHEIVAAPAELAVWLRAPGCRDWVKVNLADYFER